MRALLDTDVILDFLLKREPFFSASEELMEFNQRFAFEAYMSAVTPLNVFYISREETGVVKIRQALNDLLSLVRVCAIDEAILKGAFALPFTDFEDAVQHACPTANNLDAIVTRNLDDYKSATLPVFSPTAFPEQLKLRQS